MKIEINTVPAAQIDNLKIQYSTDNNMDGRSGYDKNKPGVELTLLRIVTGVCIFLRTTGRMR